MVTGPYQSKLLRFVIGQYRKGLERHQRAVLQTRSTAIRGAVVGSSWALVPLRGAVRISAQVTRRLMQRVVPLQSRSTLPAEDKVAQVVLGLSQCLSKPQVLDLNRYSENLMEEDKRGLIPFVSIKGWLSAVTRKLGFIRSVGFASVQLGSVQITGFASDLDTRNLVLVLNGSVVWNGLCDTQQQRMIRRIKSLMAGEDGAIQPVSTCAAFFEMVAVDRDGILGDEWVRSHIDPRKLAYSVRAFWVEVLRIVANLRRRQRRLPVGLRRLHQQKAVSRGVFEVGAEEMHFLAGRDRLQMPMLRLSSLEFPSLEFLRSASGRSLEAEVISSQYIEHPLERLLNWIDQRLLWLEQRGQHLISWLQRLATLLCASKES